MRRLGLALVLLATVAVYAPLRSATFVYEDRVTLTFGDDWQGYPSELSHAIYWPHVWDPEISFTNFTVRWQEHLGFGGARAFHVAGLGLFLVAGLLLACLAQRLGVTPWLAMGIFLLHPINTEAVAYVSKRGELLAAIVILAGGLVVLGRGSWRWRAPLLASLAIVLIHTKAPAIVGLGLWALLAWPVAPARAGWATRACFSGLFLVTALAPILWWPTPIAADGLLERTVWTYLGGQAVTVWHMAQLVVWPSGFTVDYDAAIVGPLGRVTALVALGVVAGAAALGWGVGRRSWAGFAVLWVAVSLAPRFLFPSTEWINEHQMLTPMIGLSLALGAGLSALEARCDGIWRRWPSLRFSAAPGAPNAGRCSASS